MKLLKLLACLWANSGGNVKLQTALGEAYMDRFMDRSSILLASTKRNKQEILIFMGYLFVFFLS